MSGLIDLLSVENSRIKKELGVRQEAIKNYHIEWCSANVKIAELTAKLDKAREALSVALTWSDYGTDDTAEIMRCTDAIRELDK